MAEKLVRRVLHESAAVSLRDVECREPRRERGAEERSPSHDLVFPRRGVFVKHVGRRETVADANAVLFFNPEEGYCVSHPVGCGDDCTVFTFPLETLREAAALFDPALADSENRPFRFSQASSSPECCVLLHRLRRHLHDGYEDSIACDESALRLLHLVFGQAYHRSDIKPLRASTRRAHEETTNATRLLLNDSYRLPLTLNEIARRVHTSPFHLARIFRAGTGRPVHRYLADLRCRAALARLFDGEPDLTALALELGFSSHSHFSAAFRRTFGCPPSECRRRVTAAELRQMSKNLKVAPAFTR